MNTDFTPVLLGSDVNVYGMARAFHQEYGIISAAIGRGRLLPTANSSIVDIKRTEPDLEDDEVFVKTLTEFDEENPGTKLLIPCGDGYVRLLMSNRDRLRDMYRFHVPDEGMYYRLCLKESFYKLCDQYGFKYPKTEIFTAEDMGKRLPDTGFPVIIKASDSVAYWDCSFPHKKKVFIAHNADEFNNITKAIYSSSYKAPLIIQEFVPGEDSQMRVLNCYCGSDGRVRLAALGHALLEEHSPQGIGSYAAVISTQDRSLTDRVKRMLEDIGYKGIANFDIKLDPRDGEYKFFEINLRQGRSSYFVTAAGHNLAKYMADDLVYNRPSEYTDTGNEFLWTIIPKSIIFRYVSDKTLLHKTKSLIKQGKWVNSLYYNKDMSLKRYFILRKNDKEYHKKYKRFFGNKSLG